MRFRVLGPVTVSDDAGTAVAPAPMSRVLLGVLLASAGRPVPRDVLEDALWPGLRPPGGALRWHLHQLRAQLGTDRVRRTPEGVDLRVEDGELDAAVFGAALAEGRALLADGDPVRASRVLLSALGLWRGDAYGGLDDVPALDDERRRLAALRLSAAELRIEAEVQAGRPDAVEAELAALVAAHPLREHLRALQVRALGESGRRAEALTAFDEARHALARELGVEPGAELQELHRRLVDPARASGTRGVSASAATVPSELPARIATFTGRAGQLRDVLDAVRGSVEGPVVISGAGGVGKSVLAVEAAHLLRAGFPDGALYVDLTGSTPGFRPREPLSVLHRFSRSLGDDRAGEILDLDEAAARFRTRTAGRRLLVVLDNAADAAQVRPLLPGGDGPVVLVTCRRPLGTLEGARRVALAPMTVDDALRMLARSVPDGRTEADPGAARELATLCEYLPLALSVAGARLAARPAWSVADLVARLADRSRRLEELSLDDRAVRASLAVSWDDLDEVAARVLVELALFELPGVPVGALAASTGLPARRLTDAVEVLRSAELLDVKGGRLALHDLARAFAGERAEELLTADERLLAVRRAFHWYAASARTALALARRGQDDTLHHGLDTAGLLVPGADLSTEAEAEAWLAAESSALLAAAWQALDDPRLGAEALALTAAAVVVLTARGIRHERLELVDALLARRPAAADAAWLHVCAGNAYLQLGDDEAALGHGRAAVRLGRAVEEEGDELRGELIVGNAFEGMGRLEDAVAVLGPLLERATLAGEDVTACGCANNLADALLGLSRPGEAVPVAARAVELARRLDRPRQVALFTVTLGEALLLSGDAARALDVLDDAAGLVGARREDVALALVRWRRGQALDSLGRGGEAHEARRRCVEELVRLERLTRTEADAILAQAEPEAPAVLLLPY